MPAANLIVTRATITWRRPEIRKFAQNRQSNKQRKIRLRLVHRYSFSQRFYYPQSGPLKSWPPACLSVCLFVYVSVLGKFSNFWPPSRDCSACTIEFNTGVNLKTHYQTNCNECATAFAAGMNLKRHDTLRGTVRPYNILAHSTQRSTGFEWPL